MPNPKTIKEIESEFEEQFDFSSFGENTGDGDCFPSVKEFLSSSLLSLLDEVEKLVQYKNGTYEGFETIRDRTVYNQAVEDIKINLSDLREGK